MTLVQYKEIEQILFLKIVLYLPQYLTLEKLRHFQIVQ